MRWYQEDMPWREDGIVGGGAIEGRDLKIEYATMCNRKLSFKMWCDDRF